MKLVKAHEFIYILSIPFPKLAILCLYFRLFTEKTFKYIMYATGFTIIGTSIFGIIASLSNCRPFTSSWDLSQTTTCTLEPTIAMQYYSVPNIITDGALLLLPMPALFRLNGSLLRKISVALTFLVSTA